MELSVLVDWVSSALMDEANDVCTSKAALLLPLSAAVAREVSPSRARVRAFSANMALDFSKEISTLKVETCAANDAVRLPTADDSCCAAYVADEAMALGMEPPPPPPKACDKASMDTGGVAGVLLRKKTTSRPSIAIVPLAEVIEGAISPTAAPAMASAKERHRSTPSEATKTIL